MKAKDIRTFFVKFFEERGHTFVPSSPVIPFDDPTLLFTNAGMNQFKDIFLGTGTRPYKRAVNYQKCIRVSGKHNDLEEVGKDTYHHTFFEMLGNWSFGDYYKKEAIEWAWELLTKEWGIPKNRLYATVFKDDDEAEEIWKKVTDISHDRILRFDEKSNFWEMGDTGPCGPCSEIHIDLGEGVCDKNHKCGVNVDGCLRFRELWNLVFIQFNRNERGELEPLPAKHVDTGMGLERIVAVLQGKNSNYDTDLFQPLIEEISKLSGKEYVGDKYQIAMRVIADHVRMLTFAITDGAVPSNEGRGYVLRRILRRASRYARNLDMHEPFIYKLVDKVVEIMGEAYPEIEPKKEYVKDVIKSEEENFNQTLDRGIEIFENEISKLEKKGFKILPGEVVFKLYDTYGFPVDLTNLMAQERGFSVDLKEFERLMEEQRERSREATKKIFTEGKVSIAEKVEALLRKGDVIKTEFNPDLKEYEFEVNDESNKVILLSSDDEHIDQLVFSKKTIFYPESGGQVGDTGKLIYPGGEIEIIDTQRVDDLIIHFIPKIKKDSKLARELESYIKSGGKFIAKIDVDRRKSIMKNHSATHLLHSALRKILGTHVQQAGSLVAPDRLRFDFTHPKKLGKEEIEIIEHLVNDVIFEDIELIKEYKPLKQALEEGALAFFGDKYGDIVRTVKIGDFSYELCGGTHLDRTIETGYFKIIYEGSIASGVRRIEAITGKALEKYLKEKEEEIERLNEKIESIVEEKQNLEKELSRLKLKLASDEIEKTLKSSDVVRINGFKVIAINVSNWELAPKDMDEMKQYADILRSKIESGVGLLVNVLENRINFVCVVTDDLVKEKKLDAGEIVRRVAKITGGGGGGRPNIATAGGKDISKLDEALRNFVKIVKELILTQ
ncbi:alanyl-tRNA synthetase [Candidatus Kryptobacter tengchongensis]|nr:alanyl-tRNA synthetase [Candidatus Kryptobacter tengchongensis]